MRAIVFFALLCLSATAFAARTDTVYLYNGDRITGEIKSLLDNKLSFKTDRAGTVNIEWPSVKAIYSTNYFDVFTESGQRIFGRFLFADTAYAVIIELGSFRDTIPLKQIVQIDRVKSGFFDQLSGTISLSASYTNASQILQVNGAFDITHRTRKYYNNIKGSVVISASPKTARTERREASYGIKRLYTSHFFTTSAVSYQLNTELNIASRYQVLAGAGYFLFRHPGNELSTTTGLAANVETSIAEPVSSIGNGEFVAAFRYHKFKFRNPQFDIYTNIATYTSLTNPGRFRFDFEAVFLWEIFNDFKWNVTLYNNFDNKPPGSTEMLNDWSILMGISYTL
jgi:hypothetical protein